MSFAKLSSWLRFTSVLGILILMNDLAIRKRCFSEPIAEIFEASRLLDAAVSAHALAKRDLAEELIRLADIPAIGEWTNSIWGPGGPWSRPLKLENQPPFLPEDQRFTTRMPNKSEKAALISRDGYRCRFCQTPLVRKETRDAIRSVYPSALRWGESNKNSEQHTAFQAMWLQYDHVVPHSRGGTNEASNLLITCAPCNYGRWHFTIDEVGLLDPRDFEIRPSRWEGLERFRP